MEIISSIQHSMVNTSIKFRSQEYLTLRLMLDVAMHFGSSEKHAIFGGFVRDMLLLQKNIEIFERIHQGKDFWDPSVPGLYERIVLPRNIDITYVDDDVESCSVKNNGTFSVSRLNHHPMISTALPHIPRPDGEQRSGIKKAKHYDGTEMFFQSMATLNCWSYFTSGPICCGINFYREYSVPYIINYHGDMECNSLCITQHTLGFLETLSSKLSMVSPIKEIHLGKVISDIFEKKTSLLPYYDYRKQDELTFSVPSEGENRIERVRRIVDMMSRGWTIQNVKGFAWVEKMDDSVTKVCCAPGCMHHPAEGKCEIVLCHCIPKYFHMDCFVKYADANLKTRMTIACPACNLGTDVL